MMKTLLMGVVLMSTVLMSTVTAMSSFAHADTLAIKNFRQIVSSLYIATGVSQGDEDVRNFVRQVNSRLPQAGSIDEISSPMMLALTQLSGLFCQKMVENDALIDDASYRHTHKLVNFARPARSFEMRVKQSVVQEYAELFWQRPATSDEETVLIATFDEAAASASTTLTLKILCTTMASSLDSLVY